MSQGVAAVLLALIPSIFVHKDQGLWDWPSTHLGSRAPHSWAFMWELLFSRHLALYHYFPPGQVFPNLATTSNQPITPLTSLNNRQCMTWGVELSICS